MRKSKPIVLSQDISDILTAGVGSAKSCLSPTNSHYQGTFQNVRADFATILYVPSSTSGFDKSGRQWVYLRMTENGIMFDQPFIKFQRRYGNITDQQLATVTNYINSKVKEAFGFDMLKDFTYSTDVEIKNAECSPNAKSPYSGGAGYLDLEVSSSAPLYALKEGTISDTQLEAFSRNAKHAHSGVSCLLNLPDALALDGEPTNSGNITKDFGSNVKNPLGITPTYKYVTCKVTGNTVLTVDAIVLEDNSWVSREAVAQLIGDTTTKVVVETPQEVVEEPTQITSEELESFDMEDF